MKNIYLLTLKDYSYDKYDAWVVIAENEIEVLKLCDIKDTKKEAELGWEHNRFKDNVESIKLIGIADTEESSVVLGEKLSRIK